MDYSRFLLGLIAGLTCSIAAAAPFAPAAESVKTFVAVPDADKVGIPAYPKARIFSSMGPVSPEADNHTLVLFTSDPKDKVVAFYKENLKDWTFQNLDRGAGPLIHEGKGDIDVFGNAGLSTRYVLIGDGIEPMGQTKITIGYQEIETKTAETPSGQDADNAGQSEDDSS